jgi:hypothetical protein
MEEPARNARAGRPSAPKRPRPGLAPSPAERCRRKFLEYFPAGFRDDDYVATEREYKWDTHRRWLAQLGEEAFRELLDREDYAEVASRAVRVEQQSRHSMIFSFEKMALRDAVRGEAGARSFAQGLYQFLHGDGPDEERFALWCEVVAALPRRQTRVLTWPLVTVFGFIAQPTRHLFLKPTVTRAAAAAYGFDFDYRSRPNWATYRSLLDFASLIRRDQRDLRPRDMIDLQSFIWVLGSDEYA